jgi:hypothetical protein
LQDIEKGIIMKSPNGQCWRGTLDNSGVLNFASISCPEAGITAIQELKSTEGILMYPNPNDGKIIIGIKDLNLKGLIYTLYEFVSMHEVNDVLNQEMQDRLWKISLEFCADEKPGSRVRIGNPTP